MEKINKTKYALLGMLSDKPMSGYDMKKKFDYLSYFWSENYGHIYPILRRIEAEGLVTHETVQNEGRPDKKVYTITPKGREELKAWMLKPDAREIVRSEFLLKLFYGKEIGLEECIKKIEAEGQRNQRLLDEYESMKTLYKQMGGDDPNGIYWMVASSLGVNDAKMRVAWSKEMVGFIRSMMEKKGG